MNKYFNLSVIIFALISCKISEAQNVGITDKSGGITPASTLQVHKDATSGTVLQVTNTNTGETSADGLIINRQAGSFGIINQENDTINLGGSANSGSHLSIEPDGTLVMKGQSTVFNDLMVYPDATTKGGSNSPVWSLFKNDGANTPSQGVFLWMFSPTTEQEIYFSVQIPHSYKVGTSIYPHVHWTTTTGTPSGTNVVWGLEYTVMKIGGNFGSTNFSTSNSVIPPVGTPSGVGQHLITAFPAISGNGIEISTILVCRLFRKAADGLDTFANSVGLLGFDIHYESDTQGSHTEYTK